MVNGLVLGATIALMSVGFTLIFGILGIINMWHGEAYMLGGAIIFLVVVTTGITYWAALFIAVAAVGGLGWLMDRVIFRRLHGNIMGAVIAGVALMLGIQNTMWHILGMGSKNIPSVITGIVEVFGCVVSAERLVIVGISMACISVLGWFIRSTKLGKAMRATQQDREAALTMGISTNRICGVTFGIATGLAALAGALMSPLVSVTPVMGLQALPYAFLAVILGGMGSMPGALIASVLIGLQQSFTAAFWGPEFAMAVSFGLAMVVLIARPRGLMGRA